MMLCFLFSGLIVALDQFFKQYILRTIEENKMGAEIIPGFLGLVRYENNGAMLGFLENQRWLLAGIAFVAAVVLVMILLRYNEGFWGTIGLAAVLGGTVGNLFDRIFNEGAVIDMFALYTVSETGARNYWFPIFNIADIFITLGFITFLIHFIALTFKNEEPKKIESSEAANTDYAEDAEDVISISALADPELVESEASAVYAETETTPVYTEGPVYDSVPVQQAVSTETAAQVQPVQEYYTEVPVATPAYDSVTDTTPDISATLESITSEIDLENIDVDYDVDELLREYGLDDNDINV